MCERANRSRGAIKCFAKLHILWNINYYRSGTTAPRKLECFMYNICQIFNSLDQEIMFGDWLCNTKYIRLLESITSDKWTRNLTGNGDDWCGIHKGCSQSRYKICSTRTTRSHAHTNLACCSRVAIRSMCRRLFVSH